MDELFGRIPIETETTIIEVDPNIKPLNCKFYTVSGVELFAYKGGSIVLEQLGEPLIEINVGDEICCQNLVGGWWTGKITKRKDEFEIDFGHSIGSVEWCDHRKCFVCAGGYNKKCLDPFDQKGSIAQFVR